MAPERQQPADPETVRDLYKLYEDPSDSTGFLAGVKGKFRSIADGIRRRPTLSAVLAFIAGMAAVDEAEANYPELEALEPQAFSADVNDPADDPFTPNFWPSGDGVNPRISWALTLPDWHVLSLELEPMPGSTFIERPPVIQETPDAEPAEAIVVLEDGMRFRHNSPDGSVDRQRLGEPDFSPFITGGINCIKPGPRGYIYFESVGDIYLMPVNHPTPILDPIRAGVATLASFNRPGVYTECAVEVEVAGIVLVNERLQPLSYFMKRVDGSYEGPFALPWGGNSGSPTYYVNGTGIWLAYQKYEGPGNPYRLYYAILPSRDGDGDGVWNADDNCPDDFNPAQIAAACARSVEELRALGFDRRVEPGILLAGAADVIPHPSPPPGVENPQQGVFRGVGGIRSTEAGHLIDMRADLPPPPEGFTWGSVSIEINVRDGEAIIMGDPPQVFAPADGSQMLSVDAGFQAVLQGTDVEMWVRGWTYVPLPRGDGGVGDGGVDAGMEAGAEGGADAGVEAGDGGGGDAGAGDAGHDGSYSDATVDGPSDARVDIGDVAQDQQINGDAVTDINRHEDGDAGVDANDPDANGEGDVQVAERDQDAGNKPPIDRGGCGGCAMVGYCPSHPAFPDMPKDVSGSAAMWAMLALTAVGLERRANRRRKKERR